MDLSLWRGAQPRLGRSRSAAQSGGLSREQRTTRLHTLLLLAAALPLLLLLSLPLVALILAAPPRVLAEYLGQSGTVAAIALSLSTSTAAMLLVFAMGTPLAYLLARNRLPLPRFLEVVLDMPMVLPPAVAGLALLMTFGRRGLLGGQLDALGIQLAFTTAAVVIAQMFVAAPYYIKTAALGLGSVNRELEAAAAMDGAPAWQVFRYVTLPLSWRSIVGGAALCWARALGEFGATIIFAGNYPGRTQTMPLAVYLGFEIDLYQALTLAAILLAFSFSALFAIRSLLRRAPDGQE
jgi:molybdate transport system permease protein